MPPPGHTTVTLAAYDTVVLATYYEIDPARCQALAEPVVAISQQPVGAKLYLAHTRALKKGVGHCPPVMAPQVQVMLRADGKPAQGTYKWRTSFQRYGTPADVTGTVSVTAPR
jgi:hypothetical protein